MSIEEQLVVRQELEVCKRCGKEECVKTYLGEAFEYSCTSCGYTTNSDLKEGSEELQDFLDRAPELYKAVSFVDENKYQWFPKFNSDDDKGMLFLDGSSKEDASWCVVRMVDVDKDSPMYEKGVTKKPDYSSKESFGEDYREALFHWAKVEIDE